MFILTEYFLCKSDPLWELRKVKLQQSLLELETDIIYLNFLIVTVCRYLFQIYIKHLRGSALLQINDQG